MRMASHDIFQHITKKDFGVDPVGKLLSVHIKILSKLWLSGSNIYGITIWVLGFLERILASGGLDAGRFTGS